MDSDDLPLERSKGWNWADAGRDIDRVALLHPWYYLALKGERDLAGQLGKIDDVGSDEAMMDRLKESYNRLFWNGSCYKTPGYEGPADDRVHALAVVSGIAGPDKYDAILKVLAERREAETYFMRYVIDAFFVMGRPDLALARLREYIPQVMNSYSTLWEQRGPRNSSNHAWSGHGIILCGQRLAGIEPLEPGFKKFRVRPQMASLKHIECGLETAYGMIEAVLDRKGKRINATLTVPEGTTAVVEDSHGDTLRLKSGKHRILIIE